MKRAIYAGTFDPVTFGHLDVARRASAVCDELIVAVAEFSGKDPVFDFQERVGLAREACASISNVQVEGFSGLLVDYARSKEAKLLVRGLRMFSDFEYEFQVALINRKLDESIETMFLMPNEQYSFVSSSQVRQVARVGGDVSSFVPEKVRIALAQKFKQG